MTNKNNEIEKEKFKSIIGNECATWDCKGKLVNEDKLTLKCSECNRTYWKDEIVNRDRIDKEIN